MAINSLSFNQDYSCIAVLSTHGHRIFNCDPFGAFYLLEDGLSRRSLSELVDDNRPSPDDPNSGPGAGEAPTAYLKMLFSTLLTIIVPQAAGRLGNRLLKIYNLKQNLKICELTFPSAIVDLRLNRKRLVVFLEVGQIYIYDLSCVRLEKVLETNPYSRSNDASLPEFVGDLSADDRLYLVLPLLAISEHTDLFNAAPSGSDMPVSTPPSDLLVIRSLDPLIEFSHKNKHSSLAKRGSVTLEDLKEESSGWVLVYDTLKLQPRLIYKAHELAVAKIAISNDATRIATASVKGTIIRVAHVTPEDSDARLRISQVTNLRRGHNSARVNALAFNLSKSILGCGSESNTIHFFRIEAAADASTQTAETDTDPSDDNTEGERSSEDLNENLSNLLISKRPDTPVDDDSGSKGYFSLHTLKKTGRLLSNLYTKGLINKLPYRDYFDNLIWEPPKRSFAYIRLPEYTPPQGQQHKVEIGFTAHEMLMVASYQTGTFYHYQLPKAPREETETEDGGEDRREECYLAGQFSLE